MNAQLDTERYDRSIRALTETGQQLLAATHIAVVGVGGLGSLMAEQLARYGVQTLTIIDPDAVERSNLPRLFGVYDDDVGRPKVDAVKHHLSRINPAVSITAIQQPVEEADAALEQADLIVAGVDQISTRIWLNLHAVSHGIDYIDAGVHITTDTHDGGRVDTMEGYIQRIVPGETACFDCLDRGDREQARIERMSDEEQDVALENGYIDETDLAPEPAVVPLNGVVASKTVQIAAKHVTGYDRPADFVRFEGVDNTLTAATTHLDTECPACGEPDYSNSDLDTSWHS